MIETAADLAVFFDADDFGTAATYRPQGGTPAPLVGVFTAAHTAAAGGEWPGVSTTAPALTVALDHLPPGARAGDEIDMRAAVWAVRDIQPDGTGLARLILEKV